MHTRFTFNDANQPREVILTLRTNPTSWRGTREPVIIPFSIHSRFHEGVQGSAKIEALVTYIKENVRGPLCILLSENAHTHVLSLEHGQDYQKAFERAFHDAQSFAERFKALFQGCLTVYWHTFIQADSEYGILKEKIERCAQEDLKFQELLRADAERTYTPERACQFPDAQLYLSKTKLDLIETAVFILIASKKGYRFYFYPGSVPYSLEYVNQLFLAPAQRITRVNVGIKLSVQ